MIGGLSLFSPGSIASYGSPAGFGSGQTTTLPFGVDDGRGGLCSTLECKTHGAMLKEILQARFPGLKVMGVEDGNEAAVASSSPAPAAEAATARPVATASAGLASGQTLMTAQEQGSAGNSNGAAKAPGDLSEEEKQQVAKLKQTDAKVRAHERAHAAVGGQYAGAPSYDYVRGPDGQMYAVGGEVSIDIGPENDPEATLQKAAQVAAAAWRRPIPPVPIVQSPLPPSSCGWKPWRRSARKSGSSRKPRRPSGRSNRPRPPNGSRHSAVARLRKQRQAAKPQPAPPPAAMRFRRAATPLPQGRRRLMAAVPPTTTAPSTIWSAGWSGSVPDEGCFRRRLRAFRWPGKGLCRLLRPA